MGYETRNELHKTLMGLQSEDALYFCNEDVYCELVDCSGHVDCEHCDDGYDDDLLPCEHCKGGDNLGYCEEHNGGVLSVEHHVSSGGGYDVTVCVGTGGPHIELDTREEMLIGYWGGEEVRVRYDADKCKEVRSNWEELGQLAFKR